MSDEMHVGKERRILRKHPVVGAGATGSGKFKGGSLLGPLDLILRNHLGFIAGLLSKLTLPARWEERSSSSALPPPDLAPQSGVCLCVRSFIPSSLLCPVRPSGGWPCFIHATSYIIVA